MGVLSTILSLRQKRQEWEESRPLREAQLKAFKADYDMKKSRIDLFNALSEGPGDKIEQTGQQIDSKMKEMLLSGAGQMGQMTGAGGQGMQDIMGQMPQVQTPQMMQSGQPQQPNSGGRLLDILSNPEELARYKAAGIDLTPIANNLMNQQNINYDNALSRERLDWQKQQGDRSYGLNVSKFNRESGDVVYTDVTTPQGKFKIPIPKHADGAQMPTLQIGQAPSNMPITEANIPNWVHRDTLESPDFGMTPSDAEANGFKRVSSNTLSRINDFKSVKVLVGNIEALMSKVFPETESAMGRIPGAAGRTFGALAQTDNNAALLKSMLDGTQAALVRMFEKGTLTDKDIARAKRLNVSLFDSADVAWKKIKNMKAFIEDLQKGFIGGSEKKSSFSNDDIDKMLSGEK